LCLVGWRRVAAVLRTTSGGSGRAEDGVVGAGDGEETAWLAPKLITEKQAYRSSLLPQPLLIQWRSWTKN
ncbi:unnamed protein product, partial [Urochloa humidicola]